MTMHEVTVRYDEALLKEAVRSYFLRTISRRMGRLFWIVLGVLLVILIGLVASGDRGWPIGFMAAFPLFVVVAFAAVYVAHYRNTIGRFRRMRSPEATIGLGEDELTLKSDLGSSTLPWSAIEEVWRFPRFWLLMLAPNQFITLPLNDLDPAAREFIDRKTTKSLA